jgi:hypothetical protein
MSQALVARERRREALVYVLGGVHHDRNLRRCRGEHLASGRAERLLVNVEDVRANVEDQPPEPRGVGVSVAVDIAGAMHVELDDRERLVRQGSLAAGVRPKAGNRKSNVEPDLRESAFTRAMTRIPPAVVDAQNPHASELIASCRCPG